MRLFRRCKHKGSTYVSGYENLSAKSRKVKVRCCCCGKVLYKIDLIDRPSYDFTTW